MSAPIKIGVTAWAERSLIATGWYPPDVRTAEARLRYYAGQFPIVENDSSYWAVPDRARVAEWAERTPDDFTMNMKAHALLTGHYANPRGLPAEIRDSLPRALFGKPHIYARDVGQPLMRAIERYFHDALEPLHDAGKLGVVLFQFPVWFPISHDNKAELIRIRNVMDPYRVAVEFRNATWMTDDNRHETLALLAGEDLIYTCVDEPQGFPSSVPPLAAATSDIAVVRMHGRNAARWHRGARSAAERFEYRYDLDELSEWVPELLTLAEHTNEVHVLMNNCYADYAVQNARELADLVELEVGSTDDVRRSVAHPAVPHGV